jgi:parvulin-like peptidyl-prolyl isomerase
MKPLLKEPLVHFLVLGAALFVAFGLAGKSTGGAAGKIVVTRAQIGSVTADFARTWQRPPTADELEGLIQDRVREEVYCREAIALGLDKDDTIIRRRLRQKMEFVSEDVAAVAEPTESELRAYLAAHAEAFRVEPRITFRHVYLDPARHKDTLEADAGKLLAQLSAAGQAVDPAHVGDPFLLDHTFDDIPADVIAKQFGEKFAARLGELPLGRWQGPIASGYGVHLVYVGARVPGRAPAFDEVREAVRREWSDAQRLAANDVFYRDLLKRYAVTIEK